MQQGRHHHVPKLHDRDDVNKHVQRANHLYRIICKEGSNEPLQLVHNSYDAKHTGRVGHKSINLQVA